jgi:uncharacterized membrane protein
MYIDTPQYFSKSKTISGKILKNLTIYWFYLTLFFGVAYVFILPPFQAPDEPNHFMRIYHIAQGHLIGEVSSDKLDLGGYVPKDLPNIFSPYEFMPYHTELKTRPDTIISRLFKPLASKEPIFGVFPNTARYAFTAYLPQVIITFILDKIDTPPLIVLYADRLAAFLFWLLCVYWAIRITPVYKEVLMLLTFLPTSLAVNSTLSADVVSNAFTFLIFALFLKFRFGASNISKKEAAFFFLLMLLLSWQKIVYFPLCFLLLLVPKVKFGDLKKKTAFFSFVFIVNLMIVLWWAGEINKLIYPTSDKNLTTYRAMRPECGVNPALQTDIILKDPVGFTSNLLYASYKSYNAYGIYLTNFGREDFPVSRGLLIIFKISILLFMLTRENLFKKWEKIFLLLLGHGLVIVFILSQHLHWACVGEEMIHNFGGKYYIPIYPIIFFAMIGLLKKQNWFAKNQVYTNVYFVVLPIIVQVEFLFLMVERYYY